MKIRIVVKHDCWQGFNEYYVQLYKDLEVHENLLHAVAGDEIPVPDSKDFLVVAGRRFMSDGTVVFFTGGGRQIGLEENIPFEEGLSNYARESGWSIYKEK